MLQFGGNHGGPKKGVALRPEWLPIHVPVNHFVHITYLSSQEIKEFLCRKIMKYLHL